MFTTLKNNPKKTVFFSAVIGYAGYYSDGKFKEYQYRRILCNNAKSGADEHIAPTQELTRVTVVHNPVANNRKSQTVFKKDVYPLLNLSGYKVTMAETERAEEGKELMSVLKPNDQECVCVAGGDGTLMEVVTGLLRRQDLRTKMKDIPLLLVPLGFSNSFAKRNNFINPNDPMGTYDEAIKLIKKGQTKPYNVIELRINNSTDEVTDNKSKEIFAVSGLEWSVDRDVMKLAKGKWVFGPFRYHWQYFISAVFGKHVKTNKSATLIYQENCAGCSKCVSAALQKPLNSGVRFSILRFLFPMFFKETIARDKERSLEHEEKSKISNDNCGIVHEKHLTDVRGLSVVLDKDQLKVKVKASELGFVAYMRSGVAKLFDIPYDDVIDDNDDCQDTFHCSLLQIVPETITGEHYYVDNEQLEVVPLELSVLKEAVFIYS